MSKFRTIQLVIVGKDCVSVISFLKIEEPKF